MAWSAIEWTEKTWNPIVGCSTMSPGCHKCYALKFAIRLMCIALARIAAKRNPGRLRHYIEVIDKDRQWNGKIVFVPEALNDPLRWKRPCMIFVNSMSDLFHENLDVTYVRQICEVMRAASHHTFQVLTKRADRMADLLCGELREFADLPNVWWGVSVENRRHGIPRIAHLRRIPATVRFLSVEPLLEDLGSLDLSDIHWVICGGESGPGSRPMHADWARSVRDQCQAQDVPLFFKQWGGRNKKAAGRELDGEIYDEFPLVQIGG